MSRSGVVGGAAFVIVGSLLGAAAPVVSAQQSRQEEIQKQRQEKAARLVPDKPGKIEAALFKIEDGLLVEKAFNPRHGIFARVGGFTEGSGFGGGPGYRFSTHRVDFRVSGAISTKKYWIADASLVLPRLAGEHLFAETRVRRRDFPQEDFFGLGPDSSPDARSNFALRDTAISGALGVRAGRWLTFGERVEYLAPSIGRGTDPRFPSVDRRFSDATAPGLAAQPDFVRLESFATLDYADPPLNPRAGGRYRLSYHRYDDRDLDRYSFDRWDVDLQQYLPFLKRHRTIALRALASTSDPRSGHDVPFYLQRPLGGAYTLRGFRSFRFRDLHLLLLQAEYRWEINPFVTGALFYDAGKVAHRRRDLDFSDLERDYGFGLRVGGGGGVALRGDIAWGSGEGTRYLIRFDNVF